MHSIYHILTELWRQKVAMFWPIWVTLTVGAASSAVWFIGRAGGALSGPSREIPIDPAAASRSGWTRGVWLAVILFGLFVACYIAQIFVWEDFAYYDDSNFTLTTLKNHNFGPTIWIESGRFFPLAYQEFNLIRHFSNGIAGYHVLPVLQLLIVCFNLLILDQSLGIKARVCLAACALLAPGMVISFGGLIYPERNVVFWILCLAFFVKCFDRSQSARAAVAAVVCAQFMLYYKETAFLFLWGFVIGRLLLRCRNGNRPGWDYNRLREKASRLDLSLASLGLIFLLSYGAVMFRRTNLQYIQQSRLSELEVLVHYFGKDLLVWLFAAIVAVRTYLIWRRRIVPSLFWDGLAYGALAYFAGFLLLGMVGAYYLAPVDVIAVLCLGRLAFLSWGKLHPGSKVAASLLVCAILFQSVSLSAYRIFERKNLIRAKVEIANLIQARHKHGDGTAIRLFFPFASRYLTMEFGAYLSYRGIPVEGAGDEPAGTNRVLLVSRAMTNDGLLQDYRGIMGHADDSPDPEDLVIILPDDAASFAEIAPYRDGGDLLLTYEPRPRLPQWFDSLSRRLFFSYPDSFPVPDHWLNASVTLWNGEGVSRD